LTSARLAYHLTAVAAAGRAYVVSGKHWRVGVATLTLGFAPIAINLYLWSQESFDIVVNISSSIATCDAQVHVPDLVLTSAEISIRASIIASDIIVVVVTWVETSYVMHKDNESYPSKITRVLLVEGTIYFVALSTLNTTVIIFWLIDWDGLQIAGDLVATFLYPMSSILISRFLLNISDTADSTSNVDSLSFVRPQGTMGSSASPSNTVPSTHSNTARQRSNNPPTRRRISTEEWGCQFDEDMSADEVFHEEIEMDLIGSTCAAQNWQVSKSHHEVGAV